MTCDAIVVTNIQNLWIIMRLLIKHISYTPSVLFRGHMQTQQTKIRRYRTWLIRVFTDCLQNVQLKYE